MGKAHSIIKLLTFGALGTAAYLQAGSDPQSASILTNMLTSLLGSLSGEVSGGILDRALFDQRAKPNASAVADVVGEAFGKALKETLLLRDDPGSEKMEAIISRFGEKWSELIALAEPEIAKTNGAALLAQLPRPKFEVWELVGLIAEIASDGGGKPYLTDDSIRAIAEEVYKRLPAAFLDELTNEHSGKPFRKTLIEAISKLMDNSNEVLSAINQLGEKVSRIERNIEVTTATIAPTVTSPHQIPATPPDFAGRVAQALLQPAFAITPTLQRWQRVNLGTVWGLDRGPLVGLLAGRESDSLVEALVEVERRLEASVARLPIALPRRAWRRLASDRLADFRNEGENSLGLVIEAPSDCSYELMGQLWQWCEDHLRQANPARPPALILHVKGQTLGDAAAVLADWGEHTDAFPERLALGPLARDETDTSYLPNELVKQARFDAWVAEHFLDPASQPDMGEVNLYLATKGIEDVTCALLRRYLRPGDSASRLAKKWVMDLKPRMNHRMQAICEWRLDPSKSAEFAARAFAQPQDASLLYLALRAGGTLRIPSERIATLSLEDAPLWWLLATLPPDEQTIDALLKLDKPCRAVFGLCGPEDRESLRDDGYLIEMINACRPLRPLR